MIGMLGFDGNVVCNRDEEVYWGCGWVMGIVIGLFGDCRCDGLWGVVGCDGGVGVIGCGNCVHRSNKSPITI